MELIDELVNERDIITREIGRLKDTRAAMRRDMRDIETEITAREYALNGICYFILRKKRKGGK